MEKKKPTRAIEGKAQPGFKKVNVVIDITTNENLRALAREKGVPFSEMLEDAVRGYLALKAKGLDLNDIKNMSPEEMKRLFGLH